MGPNSDCYIPIMMKITQQWYSLPVYILDCMLLWSQCWDHTPIPMPKFYCKKILSIDGWYFIPQKCTKGLSTLYSLFQGRICLHCLRFYRGQQLREAANWTTFLSSPTNYSVKVAFIVGLSNQCKIITLTSHTLCCSVFAFAARVASRCGQFRMSCPLAPHTPHFRGSRQTSESGNCILTLWVGHPFLRFFNGGPQFGSGNKSVLTKVGRWASQVFLNVYELYNGET